ncbi:MAG: hypothetical protein WBW69_07830 [Candidatus Korobacteraceae bacterium]
MAHGSNKSSPFRDGFAALMHEPALLAAELAWRWCFGLSAWILGIISIRLFLDSLTVRPVDQFLLHTMQPILLIEALQHIFRGSLSRFLLGQTVLLPGLILLWALAATSGRTATLHRLVAMFRIEPDDDSESARWNLAPIFALQLLRAMWSLIAFGTAIGLWLYGVAMASNGHALRAALALSFGMCAAFLLGVTLNWYLGIAPLFCVRNAASAREALDQAIDFSQDHAGRLSLLAFGFSLLRMFWAGMMWLAFLTPLSWSARIGGRWEAVLMGLIALVYFAGADLLYLARLGAYVSLAEDHPSPSSPEPAGAPEPPPSYVSWPIAERPLPSLPSQ